MSILLYYTTSCQPFTIIYQNPPKYHIGQYFTLIFSLLNYQYMTIPFCRFSAVKLLINTFLTAVSLFGLPRLYLLCIDPYTYPILYLCFHLILHVSVYLSGYPLDVPFFSFPYYPLCFSPPLCYSIEEGWASTLSTNLLEVILFIVWLLFF